MTKSCTDETASMISKTKQTELEKIKKYKYVSRELGDELNGLDTIRYEMSKIPERILFEFCKPVVVLLYSRFGIKTFTFIRANILLSSLFAAEFQNLE